MITVYDLRFGKPQDSKKTLRTNDLDFYEFLQLVHMEFVIPLNQKFVLVTTDRTVVDYGKFKELQNGSTLYLLQNQHQDLAVAVEESIHFVPHYNTLIESGTFEYFAEGQEALPCSLAELVDNSLSATAKNTGVRMIEIRLMFDKKPAVIVLDNGCGMTSKQLNNWAVYRLSKFTRENSTFKSDQQGYVSPEPVPRSLNSDISYFGVGGKHAAFQIGDSVRMISKPISSPDVHELVLSKEEFQKKEQNKEDVYKGTILNRKVTLRDKSSKSPIGVNLRNVNDDIQTLYINSAVDTFEFKATTQEGGIVDGVLRYHPFLYDKETYPKDPNIIQAPPEDDNDENEAAVMNQARGKRDIFECFWNGRLIPYTTISEFDWCRQPYKTTPDLPPECYSRFSGVLFTNDKFQVNVTKQKFMDLEIKLKHRDTLFIPVPKVQKAAKTSRNIQKEFTQWLQKCHTQFDKQVKFLNCMGIVTRNDVPTKKMQHPWTAFSAIELDGKIYKVGETLKSQKTQPVLYGTVQRFLLYGEHGGDVYATGGQVDIRREPMELYANVTRIIPISKIDRTATRESICKNIENDRDKLPAKLNVEWPEGNPWPQNAVVRCGTPLGPLKVQIHNRNGRWISSIHTGGQGALIKLEVMLTVIFYGSKGGKKIADLSAQSTKFGHWFEKIESLTSLGKYTLSLKTAIRDKDLSTVYGGKELPSYELKFTIKEGNAESFTVLNPADSVRVGVPFNIHLEMKDCYGHPTTPPSKLQPVIQCKDLELSYATISSSGNTLTITGVKAIGKGQDYQNSRIYDLDVTVPGLKNHTQTIKTRLLPGNPHSLHVKPNPVKVENGNPASFSVEVHDEAGNITANPRQMVRCQIPGLQLVSSDCSKTGAGQIVTPIVNVKIIDGKPQILNAHFSIFSHNNVPDVTVEMKVVPSNRISRMELFSLVEEKLELRNKERIEWQAGGLLQNLVYKLYDESNKEVAVTPEIASNIKVNWTGEVNLRSLVKGRLPDVRVPTKVQDQRFYQVSYKDQSVSFCFTIVPCPDEPARLKASLPKNTVKLGETLDETIELELVDQYDNVTKRLTAAAAESMTVEAEGLDQSNIQFLWQESSGSAAVTGVRFKSGPLGSRELCFSYNNYTERVIVKVEAGIPAKLKLLSGPELPLQVLNGRGIPKPFLVQLCDEWGNPSPDQRVVVEISTSPSTVKVMNSVISQPVDTEGKASFTVNAVTGSKGYYQLEFKGCFNRNPIPGPSVNFSILPDPNKPVKLSVNYNANARFPAGGTFPVFSVTVVSDDGSPMATFNPADLSMWWWKGESLSRPKTATELKCSKPLENEKKDCYHFRDKEIPQTVGRYTIQFSLRNDKVEALLSNQINVNVVANKPFKLGPECQPRTRVVSYSTDITSRILVENMTLKIMDQHGNPAGQDLNGVVLISMKCPAGEQRRSLPLFEGETSTIKMTLKEGSTHIERLTIAENSPGDDGGRYIVMFKAELTMLPIPLSPFELPFHFYNDSENQSKMSELTRKKDELNTLYNNYESSWNTYVELRQMLTQKVLDFDKKEKDFRTMLSSRNISLSQSLPVPDVLRLLREKMAEKERIERLPRRKYTIPNYSGQNILGKVGHLAVIADDDAAWVISWHLSGDMDCIITKTTEEAQKIYHQDCRQQVMALDSIFVYQGNRPLPHIRNGQGLFQPRGNPIYARHLLVYPENEKDCELVFKNLLGDTILMDDMDSATNYRKAVVQNRISCPTILTRQGNRLSAKGKFGGLTNKAPPRDRVNMFGAPLPPYYYTLKDDIDLLSKYQVTLEKKKQSEDERDRIVKKSPEIQQNQQRMSVIRKELDEIERQLASSSSVRLGKRAAANMLEPSSLLTKRPR
ncbi:structural maintenance of chromosomes flexible hinge domain-containing protein 1-like isoform X2 [Cyprinodon tularosa]|uniref:structural maintenance of chromosomes flexible hinge domain-containing protein 1-like isoform X2 n=1 Tax=Cyprinodon tularosa TaxID=77115 RepID=UPI0018E210CF|nr:structural maintenance of chromosomes flexible hinge domain-containing protein 1-like isoform X2 [Cyprinodon tularosa]